MPKVPQQDSYFIRKLFQLILVNQSNGVEWDAGGRAFIVTDEEIFTTHILSKYFNIGRFDSFARKLNKYGFKRSKFSKGGVRFFHKQFTKEGKQLNNIRRLTKQQTLPKHIKLKMMKSRLQESLESKSNEKVDDQINQESQQQQNLKKKQNMKNQHEGQSTIQPLTTPQNKIDKRNVNEDIDIYFTKELKADAILRKKGNQIV